MKTYKNLQMFNSLGILIAFSILLTLPSVVLAADAYPSKPLRIIAPYLPGGGTDIIGRLMAVSLTERLGKQVVMEHRPGGGSIVGTEMVARSEPDGYTLLITSGVHTAQPATQKLPYDALKSFTPLARVGTSPYVLTVNASVPVTSVKEFIALAKQKPGQLVFACSGSGGTTHIGIELFKMMADIDVKIVQFKGSGPAVIDQIGGHSHATLFSIPSLLPHIKSGKLRVLGTGGAKRTVFLPDAPTISEAGVPGYEIAQWHGLLAPAGVPAPIVERLSNEIKAILSSDEAKKLLLNGGTEAEYMGPSEFSTFLEQEIAKWTATVKKANIKLE